MQKKIIILYGPTATGKSAVAIELAKRYPCEIINADVGQFYTPLSIGTAKPDWKNEAAPHHLFDLIDKPEDFTVVQYRMAVLKKIDEITARGNIPLIVGGSGFYIKSLFYPPEGASSLAEASADKTADKVPDIISIPESQDLSDEDAWDLLHTLDTVRAAAIHKHDRYRVERALQLLRETGKAHQLEPQYQDIGMPYLCIGLMRKREELYERINLRTDHMIKEGWLDEVVQLKKEGWAPFLNRKKLIGYSELLTMLETRNQSEKVAEVIALIAQKTRHYAKRQITFWRMLEKKLAPHVQPPSVVVTYEASDTQQSFERFVVLVESFLLETERGT